MEVIFLYGLSRAEALRYYGQRLENTHTLLDYDDGIRTEAIVRRLKDGEKMAVISERELTSGARLMALAQSIGKSVAAQFKCIEFRAKSDEVGIVEEFGRYQAFVDGRRYVKLPKLDLDSDLIDLAQGQLDLTLELDYKLEVPVLVIEYSPLFRTRHQEFIQLVNSWRDHYAVSEVVLLSNGVEKAELESGLKRVDVPIYVLENWTDMPNSGIGFLLPFLRMDLEESFLLYQSRQLRQSADKMGLRSCQIEEILSSPRLLTTKNAYSNPRMLRLTVLPKTGSSSAKASLPLYASETVPGNRVDTVLTDSFAIRLFATDQHVLLKYNKLLERHCTRVGDLGSLRDFNRKRREPSKKRSLPEWFTNLSPSKKAKTSPKDSSLPTEYVMDEQELVKHANEVLLDSGQ